MCSLNHALGSAPRSSSRPTSSSGSRPTCSPTRTPASSASRGSRLSLATFSRNQEVEADRIGITIAGRAGFDPFAASRFLDKLERYAAFRSAIGKRDDAASFLASHPAALERRELALRGRPPVRRARHRRARTADGYLDSARRHGFRRRSVGRLRPRPRIPASAARDRLPRAAEASGWRTPRRRCSPPPATTRRCASTAWPTQRADARPTTSHPAGSTA